MDYQARNATLFPHSITIQDCRDSIQGVLGFREKYNHEEGTIVFNYDFISNNSFPDPELESDPKKAFLLKVRRECRGIIFNSDTKTLICRKFHKFFNINEHLETHESVIGDFNDQSLIVLEKLDGSLIAPFIVGGVLRWGSKQGITDLGLRLEEFIKKAPKDIKYNEFSLFWIKKGYTPLFEYTSLSQKIVLTYQVDQLHLLAIRNMDTGDYVPWNDVKSSCLEYSIPLCNGVDLRGNKLFKNVKSIPDLVKFTKKVKNIEGFIIRFENSGKSFKIKTQYYMDLMKVNISNEELMTCEVDIWTIVLSGQLDDILSTMTSKNKLTIPIDSIKQFSTLLYQRIEDVSRTTIEHIINAKLKNCQKKSFSNLKMPTSNFSAKTLTFALQFFDNIHQDDSVDKHMSLVSNALVAKCKEGCTSIPKLLSTKELLGSNIDFKE